MFFSKIYGSWDSIQKEKYDAILKSFPLIFYGRVLDIGSGPGHFRKFLYDNGVKAEVVCTDTDRPADVIADGGCLPFKNNSFDCVISIDSMHLIKGSDFSRALKKNGLVLLSIFFNKQNYHERKSMLEEKLSGFEIMSEKTISGRENEYVVLARKK